MIRARIVFKSGHVETLSLDELSVRQNGLGQFTKAEWKSEPGNDQILMLRLDEIAGIFSFPEAAAVDA